MLDDVNWSLFGCAWSGHVSYEPDEPELGGRLKTQTPGGVA